MKITPFRVILALNLVVIALIYTSHDSGAVGWEMIIWAMLTFTQLIVNGVLAAGTGLASLIPSAARVLKGVPEGFAISAALVLLISFPLCFALNAIRH